MRRLILLAVAAAPAAHAQTRPAIRPLGPVVARATTPVGLVTSVRALPGGRVLLNDAMQRRVVLLDSTLANATVVADTTAATGNAYGGRIGGLIPFRGDSTLFVDAASMSMLVIDPSGKVGRTMSVPRAQDANALVSAAFGTPGFDAKGRLVYRAMPQFRFAGPPPGAAGGGGGAMPLPEMPDSAALVRVDLATRVVDTVGFVKTPRIRMQITESSEGRRSMQSVFNPLPQADDWAVLSDGTIAIVRGRDYHLDLVTPDGATQSAAKVPFDWQRLTDEQKATFMDSVKAQRARMGAVGGMDMGGGGMQFSMQMREGPGGGAPRAGGEQRRVQVEGGAQAAAGAAAGGPSPAAGGAAPAPAPLAFVDPSELPDYRPPFLANSARADAQGNVWIRTTAAPTAAGALVYDVVNGKGELVDRVQVPAGRQIMGFGPDGSVFLMAREGTGPTATTTLERAKIR